MAEDFTLKDVPPEVEAAINRATNASELRELMLQSLETAGIAVRTRDDEFNIRIKAPPPAPVQATRVAPAEEKCIRVFYPRGNDRYEIYGVTEAELDAKEKQLRALFGS